MLDPVTGTGTNGDGKKVDLPQTGNNSLGTITMVSTSVAMTIAGAFMFLKSGAFQVRKKKK